MEKLTGLFGPDQTNTETEFDGFGDFDDFEEQLKMPTDQNDNQLPDKLPCEQFHGNVEYKRQLVKPSKHR